MNLQEAYSILELSPETSPEDAKKKYRELTKKYHPDVNKEDGAENKFKKINEAYRCVVNGKGTDPEPVIQESGFNPFQGFPGININPFGGRQQTQIEHIVLQITLSFKESILGCQKEISFTRNGKCADCNGQGQIQSNNGCDKCGGKGQIIGKQGNMMFTRTCDKCFGRIPINQCRTCSSKGTISTQVSGSVNVPPGVVSGNILRLNGFGHYVNSFMGMDQYSEAHLHLTVIPEEGLSLEGQDVVSHLNLSFLDALQGINVQVKTIMGEKELIIPPCSRNKDEIKIPNLGVNGVGSQKVIIDVTYPEDVEIISRLINVLNGHQTYDPSDIDHLDKD
jgi:molecular chaperone DnaJ